MRFVFQLSVKLAMLYVCASFLSRRRSRSQCILGVIKKTKINRCRFTFEIEHPDGPGQLFDKEM
jgi:hypothetical protein